MSNIHLEKIQLSSNFSHFKMYETQDESNHNINGATDG